MYQRKAIDEMRQKLQEDSDKINSLAVLAAKSSRKQEDLPT